MEVSSQSGVLCFVNGQRVDSVCVTDRGLAYGDGLFETIRFKEKRLPAWPYHLKRLSRGVEVLKLPLEIQRVHDSMQTALQGAQNEGITDGILKLIITRGSGGRGYTPPASGVSTVIAMVRPYVPLSLMPGADAVELKTCTYRLSHNPMLAGLKHLNRLEHVLAAQSVDLQTGQQGLILDSDDNVIETLHHNLFLVKDGSLFTPDLACCGVTGVMRSAIAEVFGPRLSVPVHVDHIRESHLQAADEVFICNGVHGITPVHRWQEYVWSTGEITRQLMQSISQQWTGFYDR